MLNNENFDDLVGNLKAGICPSNISLELSDDTNWEYGWEPDGSGMIWKNKNDENRTVGIESFDFRYTILKQFTDDEDEDILEISNEPPIQRIERKIKTIEKYVADMKETFITIRQAIIVILFVVVMIGILNF